MKKILYIGGSLNQTSMLHKVSLELPEYDAFFTPYYADGIENFVSKFGLLDFSVLGGVFRESTEKYLRENNLKLDYRGATGDYELIVTGSDLIIQKNIRDKKIVLVQEGMTDPEDFSYHLVKKLKIPRYFASTSVSGLSDAYDIFCVASHGYKDHFVRKGVKPEKVRVTGIPNFDDCKRYIKNDFPYKDYVLVCTSDTRETYSYENRKKFIEKALRIANGRKMIFKLHPNEKYGRAKAEIDKYAPGSMVFQSGNTNEMIANCSLLITRFSTVVYVGIALGKEVYSDFDVDELKRMTPIQNGNTSARNIAREIKILLGDNANINEFLPASSNKESYSTAG